jgi:hypothetical protein
MMTVREQIVPLKATCLVDGVVQSKVQAIQGLVPVEDGYVYRIDASLAILPRKSFYWLIITR